MTVFANIKKISKDRGMSLQDVAVKAGLSKNVIYQYNKGKNPSIDTLSKIASVLGVSSELLLGKTDSEYSTYEYKHVDIADDDVIMTFEGRPIPPEELELMKRLLRGGRNNY